MIFFGYVKSFIGGYALDGGELHTIIVDYIKRFRAECLYYALCYCRAKPLYNARAEICRNLFFGLRQGTLAQHSLELSSVLSACYPSAPEIQPLSFVDIAQIAYNGDKPFFTAEIKHGISVFGIFIYNILHRAAKLNGNIRFLIIQYTNPCLQLFFMPV